MKKNGFDHQEANEEQNKLEIPEEVKRAFEEYYKKNGFEIICIYHKNNDKELIVSYREEEIYLDNKIEYYYIRRYIRDKNKSGEDNESPSPKIIKEGWGLSSPYNCLVQAKVTNILSEKVYYLHDFLCSETPSEAKEEIKNRIAIKQLGIFNLL